MIQTWVVQVETPAMLLSPLSPYKQVMRVGVSLGVTGVTERGHVPILPHL